MIPAEHFNMIMLHPIGPMYPGTLHMGLLPIVPMLLLPFILVFFVLVFPLWGAALAILGLAYLIIRAIEPVFARNSASPPSAAVYKWLRWVLTFGGFTEKITKSQAPQPR
jgi:hypothetical protein